MFERFAQTIIVAMNARPSDKPSQENRPPNYGNCNFCGELGHFISQCPKLALYISQGKCKRNAEGKIVLPSGTFISRSVVGNWLADRFDEYHRLNPGQLAVGQTSSQATTSTMIYDCVPDTSAKIEEVEEETSRVSTEDRIILLERELLALRAKPVFDGVEVPRIRRGPPNRQPKSLPLQHHPSHCTLLRSLLKLYRNPLKQHLSPRNQPHKSLHISRKPPVHPFSNVPEAHYVPPTSRNFTGPPDKEKQSKEPAYRTIAPIHNSKFAEEVYTRSMKSPFVTLTPKELLSISPEYRQKMRDAVTPKRVYPTEIDKVSDTVATHYHKEFLPQVENEEHSSHGNNGIPLPADAFIKNDIYETYINSLQPGEERKSLTVAKESHSLRSIMAIVDNQEYIEAIIDPGSQIIAMSETVCYNLGLHFDPTIQVNMESANGEVDRSLGLARNVACNMGGITLYFQIHVIRKPAYDILIGRPFDVLTKSIIRNYSNEDQTITIIDPNSDRVAPFRRFREASLDIIDLGRKAPKEIFATFRGIDL
jgi:hypothetical protein